MSKSESVSSNALNFSKLYGDDSVNELESIKATKFIKKYGSKWRWAVMVHLMELFKKIDVQEVDLERLMFTTSFKEEEGSDENIQEFFQIFHGFINKSCLVKTSVIPLISLETEPDERKKYLIRMQ